MGGHIAGLFCASHRVAYAPSAPLSSAPCVRRQSRANAFFVSERNGMHTACQKRLLRTFRRLCCLFTHVLSARFSLAAATAAKVAWSLGPVARAVFAPREPSVNKTKPGCQVRRCCAAGREAGVRARERRRKANGTCKKLLQFGEWFSARQEPRSVEYVTRNLGSNLRMRYIGVWFCYSSRTTSRSKGQQQKHVPVRTIFISNLNKTFASVMSCSCSWSYGMSFGETKNEKMHKANGERHN